MLTSVNSRNGAGKEARALRARRAAAWVLLLDSRGKELVRLKNPGSLDAIRREMAKVGDLTRAARRRVDAYEATWPPADDALRRNIRAWTAYLDDADPARRRVAMRGLLAAGAPAYRHLVAWTGSSPEARRRARKILDRLRPLHEAVERRLKGQASAATGPVRSP